MTACVITALLFQTNVWLKLPVAPPCQASASHSNRSTRVVEEVVKQREWKSENLRVLRDVPVPQVRVRHSHTCAQQTTKQ